MSRGQLFFVDGSESRGRKCLVVGIETDDRHVAAKEFQNFHLRSRPHILEEFHHRTFTMGKTAPPKKKGGTYLLSLLYSESLSLINSSCFGAFSCGKTSIFSRHRPRQIAQRCQAPRDKDTATFSPSHSSRCWNYEEVQKWTESRAECEGKEATRKGHGSRGGGDGQEGKES